LVTKHLIVQIKASEQVLDDELFLRNCAVDACESAGATVISVHSHKFSPQGVTLIVLLAESHFSIHTWPERGTAAVDLFTCGETTNPLEGLNTFATLLNGEIVESQSITRSV